MTLGWIFLVTVCTFNTIPVLAVSVLANLASVSLPFLSQTIVFWPRINSWQPTSDFCQTGHQVATPRSPSSPVCSRRPSQRSSASSSLLLCAGCLAIRELSRTRGWIVLLSRDTSRSWSFRSWLYSRLLVLSSVSRHMYDVDSCWNCFADCVKEIVGEIGEHKSFQEILDNLDSTYRISAWQLTC